MKKLTLIATLVVISMLGAGVFAASASAFPSSNSSCMTCHNAGGITVTATLVTNDGTTAVYNVSAPGASYIVVFDGTSKMEQITGASGSVDVSTGKTYVIQGIGPNDASGQTSVSPVGGGSVIPTSSPDPAAPVTVFSSPTAFTGDARVTLTATDPAGGWGVAYIYYKLDGSFARLTRIGANQWSGTATVLVPAPASGTKTHTLQFWAQDNFGNVEAVKTQTFTVTSAVKPVPVFRFYNVKTGTHFYTASDAERASIIAKYPSIYAFEGVAYYLNTGEPGMNVPLYRFYNKATGAHFYTASADEKASVQAKYAATFTYEGVAYNVSGNTAGTPVYRFFNALTNTHFYTASAAEKDNVMNKYAQFAYEGPAFYLLP